jgi:photosystem II stability/assembly factor-like uncharacterized protein
MKSEALVPGILMAMDGQHLGEVVGASMKLFVVRRLLLLVGVIACLFTELVPITAMALNPRWDPLYDPGVGGWSVALQVSPHDSHKLIIAGDILGVGVSDDGGETWQPSMGLVAGWEMGDVTYHPTDPNVVWVGSLSGPYKSTDGGKNWTLKRHGFPAINASYYSAPIQKVCFDPNDPNTLLALGGNHRHMSNGGKNTKFGAIWKSTDGGEHWSLLTTIGSPSNGRGENIMTGGFAGGSSQIVYAGTDAGGVYKSINGGADFVAVNNGLPFNKVSFIAINSKDANIVWASLDDGQGVYKSIDGGEHWKHSSDGMDDLTPQQYLASITVCQSNPKVLYTSASNYHYPCSVYRSDDGGDHWIKVMNNGTERGIGGGTAWSHERILLSWIVVDPKDPLHVLGMSQDSIIQSWDGGQTWRDVSSHQLPDGSWRGNGFSGQCGTAVAWNPFRHGQVFTLGMDAGKVLHSDNYLWGWDTDRPLPLAPYMGGNCASFARDGTIYVSFGQHSQSHYEGCGKSTDWGQSWSYVAAPAGAVRMDRAVYTQPGNSKNVWLESGDRLYASNDGGAAWTSLPLGDSGELFSLAADPTKPTTLYVGAASGVYQTTDGTHFTLMQGSPKGIVWNNVLVDPVNPDTIYSTCYAHGNTGVWRLRDGKWTRILDKPHARELAIDPGDNRRMAVITKDSPDKDLSLADGVWISEDDAQHWEKCNDGICVTNGSGIGFNPDKSGQLIIGTDGGGFYATDLGASTPHGGSIRNIVGTLHTQDYDDGLQGFDHPDPPANTRATGPIKMKTGQWAKYSVNVPATGYYNVTALGTPESTGKVHLEFNGVNASGPISLGARPNMQKLYVHLIAGNQFMCLYAESDATSVDSIEMRANKFVPLASNRR